MANNNVNSTIDNDADRGTDKGSDKGTNKGADKNNSQRPMLLTSPKQRQGSYFEQQACDFLQAQGLVLITQNWQQPKIGELDLIMLETGKAWSTLVFVEVRQRQRSVFGDAALSVTAGKQRKIIKAAKYFLQQYPEYANYDCRFDVIAYDVAPVANGLNNDNKRKKNVGENITPEWIAGAFIVTAW